MKNERLPEWWRIEIPAQQPHSGGKLGEGEREQKMIIIKCTQIFVLRVYYLCASR